MKRIFYLIFLFLTLYSEMACAQLVGKENTATRIELFCGAELGYADTNWDRLYDVQINLTPGAKWQLGHDWTIAAQGLIPAVSVGHTYRDIRNKYWRGNMAVVAKQLHFAQAKQYLKLSAGFFSRERYGADIRWAWPVTSWLRLNARAGLTAHWLLGSDLKGKYEADLGDQFSLTGMAGADVYLHPWNIEMRATGGRYIAGDYGAQIDVMRHFSHCTLLMFAQLRIGEKMKSIYDGHTNSTNAGFKVIMMLPPYKKSSRKCRVRPASNFRLTNNIRADGVSMRMYDTDPEENEREHAIDMEWGIKK